MPAAPFDLPPDDLKAADRVRGKPALNKVVGTPSLSFFRTQWREEDAEVPHMSEADGFIPTDNFEL